MRALRPCDFALGAEDQGPALNAMFVAAASEGDRVRIDWQGTWYTSTPVVVRAPPGSEISGAEVRPVDGADLSHLLEVDIGRGCSVGQLRARGRVTSWLAHRTVDDAIRLRNANSCVFAGLAADYVRRDGVATLAGGNIIGAQLGLVAATNCGASGMLSAPAHTQSLSTVTRITREGLPAHGEQRALLDLDGPLAVQAGDHVTFAGQIFEVTEAAEDHLRVFPWPTNPEGVVSLPARAIVGSALHLFGGNTTRVSAAVSGHYCGHAARLSSLYAAHIGGPLGEQVGCALTLGSVGGAAVGAVSIDLHGEACLTRVLVANVAAYRCTLIGGKQPAVEGNGAYVLRSVDSAGRTVGTNFPLARLP